MDDVLLCGTNHELLEFKERSAQLFDIKTDDSAKLRYIGVSIDSSDANCRRLSQPGKIKRLKQLSANASFEQFRSGRASLA